MKTQYKFACPVYYPSTFDTNIDVIKFTIENDIVFYRVNNGTLRRFQNVFAVTDEDIELELDDQISHIKSFFFRVAPLIDTDEHDKRIFSHKDMIYVNSKHEV